MIRTKSIVVSYVLVLIICANVNAQKFPSLIRRSANNFCNSASARISQSKQILKDRQSIIGELNSKLESQPRYNSSAMNQHLNAFLNDDRFLHQYNELYSNPELIEKYNYLTMSEMIAIKLYTKQSLQLNALLRGGIDRVIYKQYEESVLKGWAYVLRHAVETIADEQSLQDEFKVYRIVSKSEADLIADAYENKGIIDFQEFKSTSTSLDIYDIFADMREDGGLVTISDPKGADISDFSHHPEEYEFLILGPNKFKITRINKSLVGPYLYMNQLEYSGSELFENIEMNESFSGLKSVSPTTMIDLVF